MTKKDKITITLDREVNEKIREIAEKNDRPISTEINRVLRKYIEEESGKGK